MICDSCKMSVLEFLQLITEEERLYTFLQQHDVFPSNVDCPTCEKPCKLYVSNGLRYKCTNIINIAKSKKKKLRVCCPFSVGAKKGTFFENLHYPISTVCKFVAFWLFVGHPRHTFLRNELNLSPVTVMIWSTFCREVCLASMVDSSEPLGGIGKVVELDEAKMGQRKYNRGRVVAGQWVFVGFELESKKTFFVPVDNCTKELLLKVIQEWVLPDTTIVSDCWKTYDCLADEGFQQETIRHSKKLLSPDTGTHTQYIERAWRHIHASVPRSNRQEKNFDGYLAEYQFFKKFPNHCDRLHHFFKCVSKVHPPVDSVSLPSD